MACHISSERNWNQRKPNASLSSFESTHREKPNQSFKLLKQLDVTSILIMSWDLILWIIFFFINIALLASTFYQVNLQTLITDPGNKYWLFFVVFLSRGFLKCMNDFRRFYAYPIWRLIIWTLTSHHLALIPLLSLTLYCKEYCAYFSS